ncbi:MOSC domain-containing protein [Nitrospina gracilis]|uniref:MOSC domain-containing protein n=1 Tax=Nitrospina gracilis TaxID=35801 RepID=UPI001F2F254A|nr:MOSC domain-containing protein [Nitrospina gracilis]MCF8720537.1 MOSC domain-containing protein YiiM [Nitrospina gracilis Nb-211]
MNTIVSINVGQPRTGTYDGGKPFRSGIFKDPVEGPVFLDYMGLEGDGSADLVHHRGLDKAICLLSHEHLIYWRKEIGQDVPPGFFGENFTIEGLPETKIHIGDVFRIGEAEVQCSQPRQPCHNISKRFDDKTMADRVIDTGYTGYYLRVLKQGWVQAGDHLAPLHEDAERLTVDECNRVMFYDRNNLEAMRRVLAHPLLSESWKKSLMPVLARLETRAAPGHSGTS